jgi:hypothetical protein
MRESSADNSARFDRYLLGQLGEAEAAEVEELYFNSDEEFARLEVRADDLADRYVAGRLSPVERSHFERHCLGSSDDRLRVRVAAALQRHAAQPPSEKRTTSLQSLVGALVRWEFGAHAAVAAGLMVAAGVSLLAIRTTQLQRELNRERAEMSGELAASRESAAQAIRHEQAQREGLEQRLRDLTTSSFVLVPGTARDRGSGTDLVVAKEASYVRFDLALERPAAAGRYRVTLRTIDRATLWSQDMTTASGRPSSTLTVTIPVAAVSVGQLEIVVQEISARGGVTEIATYGFWIVRGP